MAILVQDTFTEAFDTVLSAHVPDVDSAGGGWASSGVDVIAADDAIRLSGGNQGGWIDTGANDTSVSVSFNCGGADNRFTISTRGIASRSFLGVPSSSFVLNVRPSLNVMYVYARVVGSQAGLGGAISVPMNMTDDFNVRLDVIGTSPATINVYLDAGTARATTLVATRTSSLLSSGSYAGFYHNLFINNALRFDNFEIHDFAGGTDVAIDATVATKTVTPQNAVVFAGIDTHVNASLITKTVEPFSAVVALSADTAITATIGTKFVEIFNASIFAGQDTHIPATSRTKTVAPSNALVAASSDTHIAASFAEKTVQTFAALIFAAQDVAINANFIEKTVEPLNAVITAGTDTAINASIVTKTVVVENANVAAGSDAHIVASLYTKNVTTFAAEIFSGLDVHINGSLITKIVEPLNAVVSSSIDTNIAASTVTKTVETLAAIVLLGVDTAINASVSTKYVETFSAAIAANIDKEITANVRNKLIEVLPADIFAGADAHVTASVDSKTVATFTAEVYAGTDTHINAAIIDKFIELQNAAVTGVGGALINAGISTKSAHTYTATVKPGNRIDASVVEKSSQSFPAVIYTGALQASFATKTVETKNAIVRVDVSIQASLIDKTTTSFPASLNSQNTIQAALVTKSLTTFPAIVASGTPLQISARIILKTVKSFNARISGTQSIGCAVEDLNLTIPHADFDADEQQRVLIENFIRIQDCIRALMKCCAKEVGTFINAFPATKRVETRNAFVEFVPGVCVYQPYVASRMPYGPPDAWLKLNDTGTPAIIQTEGSWPVNFDVWYTSDGTTTNNILFEESPLIVQPGTTSLSFAPQALEGSVILQSEGLDLIYNTALNFELEFWLRPGDGYVTITLAQSYDEFAIHFNANSIWMQTAPISGSDRTVIHPYEYYDGETLYVVLQLNDWPSAKLIINGWRTQWMHGLSPFVTGTETALQVRAGRNTGVPSKLDQLTFNKRAYTDHMQQPAHVLPTYYCGIGA